MCEQSGCEGKEHRNGFCHFHYDAGKFTKSASCIVDGCDNQQHAKGMCNKHYRRELQKIQPECEVEGCTNKLLAHGMCSTHLTRIRVHGHLKSTRSGDWGKRESHSMYHSWNYMHRMSMKYPVDERWNDFWKYVEDVGERQSKDYCIRRKDDSKGYGKDNFKWVKKVDNQTRAEYAKEWRAKNPDKVKNVLLRRKYGITLIDYNRMFEAQNGVCKICKKEGVDRAGGLHVDHCHTTKKVRGLLCSKCNRAIGLLCDDTEIFKSAIKYLNGNSEV